MPSWMIKVAIAFALLPASSVAHTFSLILIQHNSTLNSGTIVTRITDGSHTSGIAGASTATWNWDGTTLTGTGLYSSVESLSSSPFNQSIYAEQITNLSIDTSTATASATAYSCIEGTFGAVVGASICGGYSFGTNFMDDSTTTWGPGTAVSQTLGGDDMPTFLEPSIVPGPASISGYDFGSYYFLDDTLNSGGYVLVIGNGISLSSAGSKWMCFGTASPGLPSCESVIELTQVPVPAAVWLFGSALGVIGWIRRKATLTLQ